MRELAYETSMERVDAGIDTSGLLRLNKFTYLLTVVQHP